MKPGSIHVVHKKDAWVVEEEGSSAGGEQFKTKDEAVQAGKKIARLRKVELIVHTTHGQIGERDSYGHDPRNIPG